MKNFEQKVGAELIHTESLSQAVYREALKNLGVPRAAEKGISHEAVGITMGSVIDSITGRAATTLRKNLDHVSLTTWLLTQPRKEIVQFHGWRPISTTCADELLSCICMVPLIYTDMRVPLSSRVFCTDASEFGAGGCETIGLTTAGVAAGCEEARTS